MTLMFRINNGPVIGFEINPTEGVYLDIQLLFINILIISNEFYDKIS